MTLTVLKPAAVTGAQVDSSIGEDEYPAYDPLVAYAAEARVISGNFVYQSLQAENTGHPPEVSATWWVQVSPTNRMKPFDLSHTTKATFSTSAWYEISTGRAINGVAILAFRGLRSVRVRLIDPGYGTVYDKTTALWMHPMESGWYPWTFGERWEQTDFFALDLPSYPTAKVRLDFEAASDAGIGVILVGQQRKIGMGIRQGVRMGILDYSRKGTNEWGEVELQKRGFSRTRTLDMLCENKDLDNIDRLLSDLRATPSFWILSDQYRSTNVYGKYNNYEIGITYDRYSEISLILEGLLEE